MKILILFFLILSVGHQGFTTDAPKLQSLQNHRYIIVTQVKDPIKLSQLSHWLAHHQFDVAGLNSNAGTIEIVTDSAGATRLQSQGFTLKTYHEAMGFEAVTSPDPRYLNPLTVEQKLQSLNQSYPQLTRLEKIGTSLQGRAIWALLISDTPNLGDPLALQKPSIIFDGLHHAREIMTPEIVMDVADTLLSSSKTDPKVQALIHGWQIWLVPMLNVDGSQIVFTTDNMWRKNAHADQSNIYGVDINRNYNYRWAACNGSSTDTSADDYHGPSAGSEPETQAFTNLAESVRPAASLSYHSYSEFVLYPYGCGGDLAPENVMIQKIAGELATKLPSDSGTGNYEAGTPWQLLYDVDGSSMDYLYAEYGTLAYSFEVNLDFQPDYSVRQPTLDKHRVAWTYFLNRIDQNLLTVTVVDGKTGNPIVASLSLDTVKFQFGERAYSTNSAGNYFKVLDPGHYVVTASLADGRSAQVSVDMTGVPLKTVVTIP